MHSVLLLLILALFLTSCKEPERQSASVEVEGEIVAVQQTIDDWLNIGVASHTTLTGSYLTQSFGLMEPEWRDRSEFLEWIISFEEDFGGPNNISYTFSDWQTKVKGDVAWTSVVNEATLTKLGEEPIYWKWTETGVLLKQPDGRWLIDRYHSTSIPDSE